MENTIGWENLHRVEPFRHRWLPKALLSDSPKTKALVIIWGAFGVIPAIGFLIVAWLQGSFFLEPDLSLYFECQALELTKLGPEAIQGAPFPIQCEVRGLFEDFLTLATLVSIPILFSIAVIVFPRLWAVLDSLQNVIVKAPPARHPIPFAPEPSLENDRYLGADEFNCMLKRHEKTILGQNNSKYLAVALFVLFMIFAGMGSYNGWFALETVGYDSWASHNYPLGFAIGALYNFLITGVALWFMTFKFITITHVLRSICVELTENRWILIRPTSPDKAGGLGALGTFSLRMVFVLAVPTVPIVAYIFVGNVNLLLMLVLSFFIPLLVFAFFYPLGGAHRAMGDAKRATLQILAKQSNRIYDDFMNDMKTDKPKTLKEDFELADNVDKLYVKAQQMPVWPFNLTTLGRFGGLLLTVCDLTPENSSTGK